MKNTHRTSHVNEDKKRDKRLQDLLRREADARIAGRLPKTSSARRDALLAEWQDGQDEIQACLDRLRALKSSTADIEAKITGDRPTRPKRSDLQGHLYVRGAVIWGKWSYNRMMHYASTGVRTDEPKAMERAQKRLDELMEPFRLRHRRDVLTVIKGKIETTEEKIINCAVLVDGDVRLGDAANAFVQSPRRTSVVNGHLDYYVREIEAFAGHIGKDVKMSLVTDQIAADYAAKVWKDGFTPHTYNAKISMLKVVWDVLLPPAMGQRNPWSLIKRKKDDARPREIIDEDGIKRLLAAAGDQYGGDFRLMIIVGANTGLRIGDVSTLKWSEVDFKSGFIRKEHTEKTGIGVAIPMLPELRTALEARRRELDAIYAAVKKVGAAAYWDAQTFTNKKVRDMHVIDMGYTEYVHPRIAKRHIKLRSTVVKMMTKLFERAGFTTSYESAHAKRRRPICGFHSLRHTMVTRMREAGIDQVFAKAIVGHRSSAVNDHYTHIQEQALQHEFEKISGLGGQPERK